MPRPISDSSPARHRSTSESVDERVRSALSRSCPRPRDRVFEVIKAPYGERVPRAVQEKLRVIERGSDMVLAAHYTPLRGRLKATTVETVRFYPPERVDFKLVRGPVPHVAESFLLEESDQEGG